MKISLRLWKTLRATGSQFTSISEAQNYQRVKAGVMIVNEVSEVMSIQLQQNYDNTTYPRC